MRYHLREGEPDLTEFDREHYVNFVSMNSHR